MYPAVISEQIIVNTAAVGWVTAPSNTHKFLFGIYSTTDWVNATLLHSASITSDGTAGRKTISGLSWVIPPGRYYYAYMTPSGETQPQGRWPQPQIRATASGDTSTGAHVYIGAGTALTSLPVTETVTNVTAINSNPPYWPWGFVTWT